MLQIQIFILLQSYSHYKVTEYSFLCFVICSLYRKIFKTEVTNLNDNYTFYTSHGVKNISALKTTVKM
jgi:hypothetical protein